MKLLYGTGNSAKLEFMKRILADLSIEEERPVESGQVMELKQVMKSGQVMEPVQVMKSGQVMEPVQVMKSGQVMEPKQVMESEQSVGARQAVRKENFIEILGLGDMGREVPVVSETGVTPLENARQKALAYYDFYQIPVFSCDSGLYFEGLPHEVQPGVHVRTVNGKYLTDEEMLEYYTGLAKKYGNLKARYHNAICLVMDREHVYECMDESLVSKAFLITSIPYSKVMHKGFPIDSLSVDIETGKYFYELGEHEMNQLAVEDGCREFFKKYICCPNSYCHPRCHVGTHKISE